jgi:wyosine [tRNA(Phe)-imidazoG37] synthetase (radical SAM superfamily)
MTGGPGLAFGPMSSRRLGRSLGVNNITGKTCSYSCAYCQVGRTTCLCAEPRVFHQPEAVERAVVGRLERAAAKGERIDYVTFVPHGEPTLDVHLGRVLRRLKGAGPRLAVITNASLLWRPDVREGLAEADWVSLKIDTVQGATWARLNRPHGRLSLDRVLDGLERFARAASCTLTTETMLVAGVNDSVDEMDAVARFASTLHPETAYLAVPLRPPAERWVRAPALSALLRLRDVFERSLRRVRWLKEDDAGPCVDQGDPEVALLSIAAVHPVPSSDVERLLASVRGSRSTIERLVRQGRLERVRYRRRDYYRACAAPTPSDRLE